MRPLQAMTITGAGAFAREVFFLANSLGHRVEGFLCEITPVGTPVLCTDRQVIEKTDLPTVIAVGNPSLKKRLALQDQIYLTLIAKSVICHAWATNKFLEGSIFCDGCILTTNISIGKHVILNLGCLIGHDVTIGDYCTLSPGVKVMGNAEIGEGCDIGTGAIIIPKVELPPNGIIGAGAVVTKTPDIIPGSSYTMVGVPAKVIKSE